MRRLKNNLLFRLLLLRPFDENNDPDSENDLATGLLIFIAIGVFTFTYIGISNAVKTNFDVAFKSIIIAASLNLIGAGIEWMIKQKKRSFNSMFSSVILLIIFVEFSEKIGITT